MSSPYYDEILSLCWDNDVFIYPLHLGGDRFNIVVYNKHSSNVDDVVRNLDKTKKKILEYYKFYHEKLVK